MIRCYFQPIEDTVHKDLTNNIYKIDIRPLKNKLDFTNKLNLNGKEYTLQDGAKAIYFEHQLFNFFVFEKIICSICLEFIIK